jgi:hypothetical protein
MFTENNIMKYMVSIVVDLYKLYSDYAAGKMTLIDACTKYKDLKDFYKMVVMCGDMQPEVYKAYFIECPTFEDFFAYMEANPGEA